MNVTDFLFGVSAKHFNDDVSTTVSQKHTTGSATFMSVHTHIGTHIDTDIDTQTYTHTNTDTHIHTHICTHTYTHISNKHTHT